MSHLSDLLEEHFVKQPDGIVVLVCFKSGQAIMGAMRPARTKNGDRVEGFYELTAGASMMDPSTQRPVQKLFSSFFALDVVERIAFEVQVEKSRLSVPKGGIIVPST